MPLTPKVWADDEARRTSAQIPQEQRFATKPEIACDLIAAALDGGVPCAWVLADALYGSDSRLRRMLEEWGQPYVLAVRSNHCLRFARDQGIEQADPETMATELKPEAWSSHAAGEGAKGLRLYDWARIPLSYRADAQWERWLLIRRSRREPDALAYYFVFAPAGTELCELAGAAGLRWTVEECFQRAKVDLGLDHCEARSLARLAPPYDTRHGRRSVPRQVGRRLASQRRWQSERNESKPANRRHKLALLPSVAETRYLITRLLLRPPIRPPSYLLGHSGVESIKLPQ